MIVYTGGTFDTPHLGHVHFFRECKRYFPNSFLVVALNTDEFIERFKGIKPVYSYEERKLMLESLDYIDMVTKNVGEEDSKITIEPFRPEVIVIGNDWLEKDYCKQMGFDTKWLNDNKIAIFYLPRVNDLSSTELKRRINERTRPIST